MSSLRKVSLLLEPLVLKQSLKKSFDLNITSQKLPMHNQVALQARYTENKQTIMTLKIESKPSQLHLCTDATQHCPDN